MRRNMATKKNFGVLIFSFSTLLTFAVSTVSSTPLAERSILFEDVKEGVKLTGSLLAIYKNVGVSTCSKLCLDTLACLSFNWCSDKMCQLNSADTFSISYAVFEQDVFCTYLGMNQNDTVECRGAHYIFRKRKISMF